MKGKNTPYSAFTLLNITFKYQLTLLRIAESPAATPPIELFLEAKKK